MASAASVEWQLQHPKLKRIYSFHCKWVKLPLIHSCHIDCLDGMNSFVQVLFEIFIGVGLICKQLFCARDAGQFPLPLEID